MKLTVDNITKNGGFTALGSRSLKEEQDNDKLKEKLAKENGIEYYITIDARLSESNYIKNNIVNSNLSLIFNLSNINWDECNRFATNSLVLVACNYWTSGIRDTFKITIIMNMHRGTIIRYLKQGAILGISDYNPIEEIKKSSLKGPIKIICLTTGEIFNSISEAFHKYGITNISNCCLKKYKCAGKHPETGEKMVWMYYDEYTKLPEAN